MSLTGEPGGQPMKVAVGISDVMCGMYAANAIQAALFHRAKTGAGQYIDISLVDCQVSWLINEGVNFLTSGKEPDRRGNQHPNIVPYQVFECVDGHVIVAVGNDTQFQRFVDMIGLPNLSGDERFRTNAARLMHRAELIESLSCRILNFKKSELVEGMEQRGIPGGEINTVEEAFNTSQVEARGMKIAMKHPLAGSGEVNLIGNPLKFSATPVTYRYAPPLCGQHTEEILNDFLGEG